MRCAGYTKMGKRCRAMCQPGRKYCYNHTGGKAATKKKINVKKVDRASCRPKTKLGRPARKLPNGRTIPTARQYISKFAENERKSKLAEYLSMSGCDLVNIAE